jgi:leucyl-tRNA synthetase
MTVLANERLDGDRCERCGGVVGSRVVDQWALRITACADRLVDGPRGGGALRLGRLHLWCRFLTHALARPPARPRDLNAPVALAFHAATERRPSRYYDHVEE